MTKPRTISKESRFFVVGNTREEDVACLPAFRFYRVVGVWFLCCVK
jgi:hypothetical protein